MKTFLVNLDRNPERLAFMDAELKRRGIEYERIAAVDGRALPAADRRRMHAAFRSFCLMGRRLLPGEIGCALSHVAVCRRIVAEGIPVALVLEDDVVLGENFDAAVSDVSAAADLSRPQVFILSSYAERAKQLRGIMRTGHGQCTDGYVITLQAARVVLRANFPVVAVADYWRHWSRSFGLEVHQVFPPSVCQDNERFGTEIDVKWTPARVVRAKLAAVLMRPVKIAGAAIDIARYNLARRRERRCQIPGPRSSR